MTSTQAAQIAALLNDRNQLSKQYTAETILKAKGQVIFREENGIIVACGECKKVQWYQWEICHVSVLAGHGRKGLGSLVVEEAEKIIKTGNGRIAQCTIREGNLESEALFNKLGYARAIPFYNASTGNRVYVYQKDLAK